MTTNARPRSWDCSEARVALGVYVLGAIDPQERALLDAHLTTCEACQAELAELADLPALLALVPADEAFALAEGLPGDHLFPVEDILVGPFPDISLPAMLEMDAAGDSPQASAAGGGSPRAGDSPQVLAPVVDLDARRRRRLARAAGVAAAAVIIGAASFAGAKLTTGSAPGTSADAQHPNGTPNGTWLTAQGGNGVAAATVSYRSMGWGLQLDAKVTGIPIATPCAMWVVLSDGQRAYAGSWITDAQEGSVWYPASAATTLGDVKAFVITIAGRQQITVTPA
jgi:hypothetical protein